MISSMFPSKHVATLTMDWTCGENGGGETSWQVISAGQARLEGSLDQDVGLDVEKNRKIQWALQSKSWQKLVSEWVRLLRKLVN